MAKTTTKKKTAVEAKPEDVITTFKGFGSDWKCRDFQYEVGKSYEHAGEALACNSGFHACEYPLHVFRYYRPASSKFAVVEQSGTLSRNGEDSKVASSKITIKAELDLAGLIKAAIKYTMDRCTPGEGANSTADNTVVSATKARECATASGDYGAATASGRNGKAKGKEGCALFLTYRDSDWKIVHAKALIVGKDGIKADTFYRLDVDGNAVEVAA